MKLRTLLTFSVLSMGIACGSSKDTTAPLPLSAAAFINTYTLTQVNGTALPAPLVESGTTYTVTAGTAQITSSSTWTATFITTGTPSSVPLSGTYTVTSTGLSLAQTGVSGAGTATLSGNTLTVTTGETPAHTFTYTKATTN